MAASWLYTELRLLVLESRIRDACSVHDVIGLSAMLLDALVQQQAERDALAEQLSAATAHADEVWASYTAAANQASAAEDRASAAEEEARVAAQEKVLLQRKHEKIHEEQQVAIEALRREEEALEERLEEEEAGRLEFEVAA